MSCFDTDILYKNSFHKKIPVVLYQTQKGRMRMKGAAQMSAKRKMSTRKLTVTGMMIAITMILAYTPLGIIPLQPVSATISHIPTIIIAILEGPVIGAITGCAFGIVSMIKAITAPSGVLDPCFINPIVSVFPRILIGLVSGYSYIVLYKVLKKPMPSAVISAALGSLTNTIGAMGLMYLIYAKSFLTQKFGASAGSVVWGIITTYGIVEMAAAAVICTAVVVAMKKAFYARAAV